MNGDDLQVGLCWLITRYDCGSCRMQVYPNERESWGFWSLRFPCGGLSALGLVRSDSFMFVPSELG